MPPGKIRKSILRSVAELPVLGVLALLPGVAAGQVAGQAAGQPPEAVPEPSEPGWRERLVFTVSERLRAESVDWFEPKAGTAPGGAGRYSFLGSQLRAGMRFTAPSFQAVFEAQDTRLFGLPEDANRPAPAGNLGPGATYFAQERERNPGRAFVKQANVTFRRSGFSATVGRFDHADGLESLPTDSTLLWLRRSRLAERLVGPYGYTHATRGFDGLRAGYDRPEWNATAFLARPTQGGFELDANEEIRKVALSGLTLTWKPPAGAVASDLRLFYLGYEDRRGDLLRTDNRPRALREADHEPIRVHTFGGHVTAVRPAGPGLADALLWAVHQRGAWGDLDHSAWAVAAEIGYQWPRIAGSPWVRAGIDRSSGDPDPGDGRHETFFQVLPTPRIYAQFPFFNLMNLDDRFAQLILRPHDRVTVRADFHRLKLAESSDLWYSGGGAIANGAFGYSGAPSGGRRDLARLIDLGVTVQCAARLTLYGYLGRATPEAVIESTFRGRAATYGYLEATFRY